MLLFKIINFVSIKLSNFKIYRILILYKLNSKYKHFNKFRDFSFNSQSVFIDIGANRGKVSMYVSDYYNCKIFSYEPHPGAFKYLKKKFNNLNNIQIFNYAISNKNSKQKFYLHKNDHYNGNTLLHSGSASLEKDKNNLSKNNFIEVQTIDILAVISKYKYIDCIKIDIEGHEYEIFPVLIKNLHKIGKIVCEMHGNAENHKNFKEKYDYYLNYFKKKNLLNNKIYLWE